MRSPKLPGSIDVFMVGTGKAAAFSLPQRERLRRSLQGNRFLLHDSVEEACAGDHALIVRADWAIEKRILQAFIKRNNTLLKQNASGKQTYIAAIVPTEKLQCATELIVEQPLQIPASLQGSEVTIPDEICGSYEGELRKREAPVAAELTLETQDQVERALFRSSYKGATDFITKYLWPIPALFAVRVLAQRGISPNAVTLLSLMCVIATFILFWNGSFWWGLGTAYLMAFLDTVDGKLARVTLTSSRWGHLLDHGIDLVSPPFWWGAWFAGLINSNHASTEAFQNWGWLAFWVIMIVYWLVRGIEALFVKAFGFNIHIWKPADFAFRLITTRRNINIAILTAALLIDRPDLGFIAVGAWAVVSLAYHTFRLGQAWNDQQRGDVIRSWLS